MKISGKIYWAICLLLVSSLLFSYQVNSLCIIALLLIWLLEGRLAAKFRQLAHEPFFLLSVLMFGLYLVSVAVSDDKATARFFVEKNLSLVVLPMVLLSMPEFSKEKVAGLGKVLIAGTIVWMSVATMIAIKSYIQGHNSAVFFYHKLSEPVGMSAIVASLFCILSFAWLFHLPPGKWKIAAGILLACWLLLLTSKLFVVLLLLLLVLNLASRLRLRARVGAGAALVVIVALLSVIPNPVKKRFGDIGKFQRYYLTAPDFNEGIYFDGLSLRLVFARFGLEIMNEKKSYVLGTGTGDAEALLKQKIQAYHMYQGDGIKDKEGYLQYGYHNEFLQRYVQLGITGLLVFIAWLACCYYMALRYRHGLLLNLLLVFTFTFFTDTLLEQQVGLVLFLTFSCLAMTEIRKKKSKKNVADAVPQPI
jgi:O-antigen ligase